MHNSESADDPYSLLLGPLGFSKAKFSLEDSRSRGSAPAHGARAGNAGEANNNLRLARVLEQHRASYVLALSADERITAQPHPRLKRGPDKAAVGDFVWLDTSQNNFGLSLPRFSVLKRAAAGERYQEQVLAANIDCALLVCGLDRDYSPRRIERYLTLINSAGVRPVVILSKADQAEDAQEVREELEKRLVQTTVLALDTRSAEAAKAIQTVLRAGETGVLLGSSGAGKSTLSNTLAEYSAMATGSVREKDGRGRHTTVHRSLLCLPWGACLIDSPGLREIKLTGEEDLESETFADIAELALSCRFRDCQHESEPGCAVLEAIEASTLSLDRLDSYAKLQFELANAQAKKRNRLTSTSKRR